MHFHARPALLVLTCLGAALAAPRSGAQHQWDLPPRVASPAVPAAAPMTPARIALGRRLFYDLRLSGNGTQSCATCHRQELVFTDARAQAVGSTGMVHSRSAMSLVNVAYRDALTWADPALRSLEEQALIPMFGTSPIELGLTGQEARVYAELGGDPVYQRLFQAAFPGVDDPVTTPNVALALAAFQRSIVSFRSPFDRYRQHEDRTALSASAMRGSVLFFSGRRARCSGCHRGLNLDGGSKTADSPADEVPVFQFHNTGLYNLSGPLSYPADDTGLHKKTGRLEHDGQFRIPTLRNIALTAPYMHDGSLATLDAVLDHYVTGGRTENPRRSSAIRPLTLTADDRRDLVAFLESLTDEALLRDPRWSDPWTAERR